jgi:hypothetical protein
VQPVQIVMALPARYTPRVRVQRSAVVGFTGSPPRPRVTAQAWPAAAVMVAIPLTDLVAPVFLSGRGCDFASGRRWLSPDRRSDDDSWLSLATVCRRLARITVLVCAAAAACTAPNPLYQPRVLLDAASSSPGPGATPDASGATDARDGASDARDDSRSDLADAMDGPASATRFSFESSTQGWQDQHAAYFGQPVAPVTRVMSQTFDGAYSIAIALQTMNNTMGNYRTEVGVTQNLGSQLRAGTVITYHIWFPDNGTIEGVQPYVFYFRPGESAPVFAGIMPILFSDSLNQADWTTVTHRVPADVDGRGVTEVGLEWRTNGPQTVTVYMDAITW